MDSVDGTTPFLRPAASLVASNVAKTAGENTQNILNAPKIYVQSSDILSLFSGNLEPYDSLNGAIDKITRSHPQTYDFVRTNPGVHLPLTDIAMSTLGSGHFKLTITYEDDAVKTIEGSPNREGIFDNSLYLEGSEDFVDTFTLINFGDE